MKKSVLLIILMTVITLYADKFSPNNEILKKYKGITWFSAKVSTSEGEILFNDEGKYNFQIIEEKNIDYLKQWFPLAYTECFCHSRKEIKYMNDVLPKNQNKEFSDEKGSTEEVNTHVETYKIYADKRKGVFYVKNFIDLKGEEHKRLYFGFDKKLKKMVILDKKLNIIEVLEKTNE